jgi:hypothetical protein
VETINEAERPIREAVPIVRTIYLEFDIYDPAGTAEPARPADAPHTRTAERWIRIDPHGGSRKRESLGGLGRVCGR